MWASKTLDLVVMEIKVEGFLCGISPHLVRSGDISLFVCIREPRVCDVVSIGRERTLGMSVCVWRPFIVTCLGCCQLANHFDLFPRFDQFTR